MTTVKSTLWLRMTTLLLGLFMLQSCNRVIEVEPVDVKSHVQVTVSPFYFEMEDMAPATRGGISDAATRLSFAVFDAKGVLVDTVVYQKSSDDAFGSIALELFSGSYTLVAVAHNGDEDAVITSAALVTLPGTTFTDTFAEVKNITVQSGKDCDVMMDLPRATSAFVLRLTDTPPADAAKIKIIVNSSGNNYLYLKLDPANRSVTQDWKQTSEILIENQTYNEVPVYFIGMDKDDRKYKDEGSTVTVEATAYNTKGEVIISHTIPNVPLNPNQKTIATGCFFKSQGSSTFTVESTWDEDEEISY